mgnify:CR=1 FL=1
MAFTTAQKREVIQRHYPTANNIAVKGNVFFAAFPDAEPIIGWLHSPRETLWIQAVVPVSACTALRTVPPLWFIEAAQPYMRGDERKEWYLYTLRAAQQTFPSGDYMRWITLNEGHPLRKAFGDYCAFDIEGKETEFRIKKADLLYVLTDEPGSLFYEVTPF